MTKAIQNWNLDADRNINYRSFEPILQLAQVKHTPQCAHWAAWALANLTKVYRKYIFKFLFIYKLFKHFKLCIIFIIIKLKYVFLTYFCLIYVLKI